MMHPLRQYREDNSVTLKQMGERVAKHLGGQHAISEAQISRIELGKRGVTLEMAVAISKATDGAVKIADLLTDDTNAIIGEIARESAA